MLNAAAADAKPLERTLAIIKPDAASNEDAITVRIQKAGFTILNRRKVRLSPEQASEFYVEHQAKPFYHTLVEYMSSGPVIVMVLAKQDAITAWRQLIGPTDAQKAKTTHPDSLRGVYGTDGTHNAVHGSDSVASAERECRFFFPNTSFYPLPPKEDAKAFLDAALYPTLTKGLTELCKTKPENPAAWLGQWLLDNNPNKPRVVEPSD